MQPLTKAVTDFGPLLVFFAVYAFKGLIAATAVFIAATLVALAATYILTRKLSPVLLFTGAVILVFGGLTVSLADELFIKLKPTIVNGVFALVLFIGLLFRKSLIKPLFGTVLKLEEKGWSMLTLRWATFFLVVALLNEFVWRNFSTDVWVTFKVFGIIPLIFIFHFAQIPLMKRYSIQKS